MFAVPFLIGLAGSLHCIGMCNPLVMAVSGKGKKAVIRNLSYNTGRILTYGLLGVLVSFFGAGLSLVGIQQSISLIAGISILVIAIANIRIATPSFINHRLIKLVTSMRGKFKPGPLLMGMINGVIPCGMTLVALGYCITLDTPVDGFLAMIIFGIGTMPAMFGISSILKSIVGKLNLSYRGIQTTLLIISGIILIGRGLAFDGHADHQNDDGIVVCGIESSK